MPQCSNNRREDDWGLTAAARLIVPKTARSFQKDAATGNYVAKWADCRKV